MIANKTTEEIRVALNIVNDFTPEEEEQIQKENEWVRVFYVLFESTYAIVFIAVRRTLI